MYIWQIIKEKINKAIKTGTVVTEEFTDNIERPSIRKGSLCLKPYVLKSDAILKLELALQNFILKPKQQKMINLEQLINIFCKISVLFHL